MLKKFTSINKNTVITAIVVFVLMCAKTFFELYDIGTVGMKIILLTVASGAAFALFFCAYFSSNGAKDLEGRDVVGIIALLYVLALLVNGGVVNDESLIFTIAISVMLLMLKNFYLIIAVAVISVILALFFNYAAVTSIPASMGVSMVIFAGLFEKEKKLSKKKALKEEAKVSKTKEKVIFAVCEAVMLAAVIYAEYERRFTVSFEAFKVFWIYSVAGAILFVVLVALAVLSVKNKKTAIEALGYFVPAALLVPPLMMGSRMIPMAVTAGLLMMFVMCCSEKTFINELVEKGYGAVRQKIGKKAETEE